MNRVRCRIELHRIGPNELHIALECLDVVTFYVSKHPVFNGPQVHRLLDDIMVTCDCCGHRFAEDSAVLVPFDDQQQVEAKGHFAAELGLFEPERNGLLPFHSRLLNQVKSDRRRGESFPPLLRSRGPNPWQETAALDSDVRDAERELDLSHLLFTNLYNRSIPVTCYDAYAGGDGPAAPLVGGEGVAVSEALGAAVALLRRGGALRL
mmetsp:Transcript_25257/g.44892  ORF Transcript_25257/g.44892 Transcript_25257/m.44892 type:complete len:208 (+) Transcript_25257:671-1294(+)